MRRLLRQFRAALSEPVGVVYLPPELVHEDTEEQLLTLRRSLLAEFAFNLVLLFHQLRTTGVNDDDA
jgi:hypothetical protein